MSFIDFEAPTNFIEREKDIDLDNLDNFDSGLTSKKRDREEDVDEIFRSLDDDDNDDGTAPLNSTSAFDNDQDNDEAGTEKPKRVLAKIDPERLLGQNGLPALLASSKNWKFRGKGHEIEDLKKLLSYYQLWAHKMFPKTQFSDTIEKVEKMCHQRRMEAALKGWKDANDHKRTLELEGGVEIPDNLEREQEMDINIDQNNTTDVGNDDRRSASPALFRSPSPPADIPPDEDIEHLQRNDDEATRDALENEALAELEKELGGF
ncbi:Swi3-domain-containing protein [Wallemia mellicola]|nr:Swi3-domain-containing protein [Wallemia mellicola]